MHGIGARVYRRDPLRFIAVHSDAKATLATAALAIVGSDRNHQGLGICSAFFGPFLSALLPE